jgi:hypothetical protein
VGVVLGEGGGEALKIGRVGELLSGGAGLLDLLEMDNIGVVAEELGNRLFEADGGGVGRLFIPDLAELHVKLQDAK